MNRISLIEAINHGIIPAAVIDFKLDALQGLSKGEQPQIDLDLIEPIARVLSAIEGLDLSVKRRLLRAVMKSLSAPEEQAAEALYLDGLWSWRK